MEPSSHRNVLVRRASATLCLDLLQRPACCIRHEQEADHAAYEEEDHEYQGDRPDTQTREHRHEETPDSKKKPRDAEREPLRRGPEHGGEHFLRPCLVEWFSRER